MRWSLQPSVAELAAIEATELYDPFERKYEEQPEQPHHRLRSTPVKESNTSKTTSASVAAVAPLCSFIQQGRCSKGSACPFTHAAEAVDGHGPRPSVPK